MTLQPAPKCVHHWLCGQTVDRQTPARCKKCGLERVFIDETPPSFVGAMHWNDPVYIYDSSVGKRIRV